MPPPAAPTPNPGDQNPKSILLADKPRKVKSNEQSSLHRVTFATTKTTTTPVKLPINRRDVLSSPVTKPMSPSPAQDKIKKPIESKVIPLQNPVTPPTPPTLASRKTSSTTNKVGTTTLSSFYQSLKESANTGGKKIPEFRLPEKKEPVKDKAAGGRPSTATFYRHKSLESLGHSSKRSTLTSSSRRGVKTKKYFKSSPRLSRKTSKTPSISRRSKSGKRIKKRKSVAGAKSKDNDLNAFKPAKLDDEYARELNNITQILRAVSNFDATTGTGSGVVDTTRDRVKVTTVVEGKRSNTGTTEIVHRPLSGNELKQLLSSITRVVSLHQLPTGESQNNIAGTGPNKSPSSLTPTPPPTTAHDILVASIQDTELLSKTNGTTKPPNNTWETSHNIAPPSTTGAEAAGTSKKKKGRKVKVKDSSTGGGDDNESIVLRRKQQLTNNKFKSKGSIVRKGRSKSKLKKEVTRRSSSISSSEKDPVQNAAFLRKYFEESLRLATKQSSEELDINAEGGGGKQKRKKVRKGAAKKTSSKSIPRTLLTLDLGGKDAVKETKSDTKTKTTDGGNNKVVVVPKQPATKTSSPAIRDFLKKSQQQEPRVNLERPKSKGSIVDTKKEGGFVKIVKRPPFKTSTNVSTTAVAGSLRSLPPAKRGSSETKLKGRKGQPPPPTKVRSKSQGPPEARIEIKQVESGSSEEVLSSSKKPGKANNFMESFVTKINNESANISKFRPFPQTPVKFPITDPMKNSIAMTMAMAPNKSQQQFNNVQDVVNSKYAPDPTKMKSIWDKTPYEPMTHERFKELVSKYTHVDVLHNFKEENEKTEKSSRQRTPSEKKSGESTATTSKKVEEQQRKTHSSGRTVITPGRIVSSTPPRSALKTPILPYVRAPNPEKLLLLPKPWEYGPESSVPVRPDPTVQQLQPPPTTISKWIGSDGGSVYNRLNYDYNEERLNIMRQAHRARQRLREEIAHRKKSTTKGPIGGPLVEEPVAKDKYDALAFYRNAAKNNARTY